MELIIFDLDGVIVSTDQYHYQAWQKLSIQHNLTFNRELNEQLRGVSRAESLNIILSHNEKKVDDETFDEMLFEKNEIYKNLLNELDEKAILPGVLEFIHSLKEEKIKIAIGSSSKNAPFILKKIGLAEAFDVIIDGNHIEKSKPNPEVFLKGAEALNIASKKCVVFEDAEAGVEAALACGMKVVGVGEHQLRGANLMLSSLEDLSYESLCDQLS